MATPIAFSTEHLIKTELPPLSSNVLEIRRMVRNERVSQRAIADVVRRDPVLASRILRLANSAFYAGERNVSSVVTAVSTIGNELLAQTALVSGMSDAFGLRVMHSPVGKEIWTHLLATAIAASDMCRLTRMRGADEAFTCGLLHDIGKLLFLRADGPLYVSILERAEAEGDLSGIEREAFGLDHVELGAAAAEAWNLPPSLADMIRFHHEPERSHLAQETTGIVAVADNLGYLKAKALPIDYFVESKLVMRYGLKENVLNALWEETEIRIEELTQTVLV